MLKLAAVTGSEIPEPLLARPLLVVARAACVLNNGGPIRGRVRTHIHTLAAVPSVEQVLQICLPEVVDAPAGAFEVNLVVIKKPLLID
jgi:hypothetical protein